MATITGAQRTGQPIYGIRTYAGLPNGENFQVSGFPKHKTSFCATSVIGETRRELDNCQSLSFCLLFSFNFPFFSILPYGG